MEGDLTRDKDALATVEEVRTVAEEAKHKAARLEVG